MIPLVAVIFVFSSDMKYQVINSGLPFSQVFKEKGP